MGIPRGKNGFDIVRRMVPEEAMLERPPAVAPAGQDALGQGAGRMGAHSLQELVLGASLLEQGGDGRPIWRNAAAADQGEAPAGRIPVHEEEGGLEDDHETRGAGDKEAHAGGGNIMRIIYTFAGCKEGMRPDGHTI